MIKTIEITPWEQCSGFWADPENSFHESDRIPSPGMALCGAKLDLSTPRSMMILSRLPRRTEASESWLAAVKKIVQEVKINDGVIVSSFGILGWDYISWYAAANGLRLWIVLPPGKLTGLWLQIKEVTLNLNLNPARVTFFKPVIERKLSKKYVMHLRDELVFKMSHTRYTVSLRKDSFWKEILKTSQCVRTEFEVDYPDTAVPDWMHIVNGLKSSDMSTHNNLIFHWTRGTYSRWQGETKADYFAALTKRKSGSPRDAFSTLINILECGVIRSQDKRTRGRIPVVSFTETPPVETVKRISWRNTLGHYNWEPYGIGFDREALLKNDLKPVIYGDETLYDKLPAQDKHLFQLSGRSTNNDDRKSLNWTIEREWRKVGDFKFQHLHNYAQVIVPFQSEAAELKTLTDIKVVDFESQIR